MSKNELERRKLVSFLQAEGLKPLPQLQQGYSVTARFRALSYTEICIALQYKATGRPSSAALHLWTEYFCKFADEIPTYQPSFFEFVKAYLKVDSQLLDLVQFLSRAKIFERHQFQQISKWLQEELIGFRFVGAYDGTPTLLPIQDQGEADANQADFADLSEFSGAMTHFLQSVEELRAGHFRGSVTESISGVESVIKSLTGRVSVTLGDGLKELAKAGELDSTLKAGLEKIYGWTNGPNGMRHALSDKSKDVTEAEARFMLSACLAFAAWLKRSFPT